MRFRATIASASLLLAVLGAPERASAARRDWVLAKATATNDVDLIYTLRWKEHRIGDRQLVGGFGSAITGPGADPYTSYFYIVNVGDQSERTIRTTGTLGGSTLAPPAGTAPIFDALEPANPRDGRKVTLRSHLAAGQTWAMLLFFGNGSIDQVWALHSENVRNAARFSLRTGSGTQVLYAADPRSEGVGAGAASTTVAAERFSAHQHAGLVGALMTCIPCNGIWQSPVDDGRMIWAPYFYCGRCAFAGPACDWSWTWVGGLGSVAAAWAPVGIDWKLFSEIPQRGVLCTTTIVAGVCLP